MAKPLRRISAPFFDPSFKDPDDGKFSDWSLTLKSKHLARPPVAVNFAGTVAHEKPDPFSPAEQLRLRAEEMQRQLKHNAAVLEKAVFILSQSPTGRSLLEEMTREGYKIVFDDRRTGERGAGGLCDPNDKMIILHAHNDAEYLALLLGHEAVHAVQNTRHDLFPSTRHRPETGIQLSFAIEADAYAQQMQIALELSCGDPEGPPDQIRFQEPLRQMQKRFPDILKAATDAMQKKDALKNGATVAAAFQAFYDNFYLRTFYEESHMEWANLCAPKIKGSFPWLQKHFTKNIDSAWLKDRIQHKGVAYLNIHAPELDLDDARHAGLTAKTVELIKTFYKKFLPRETPPVLKQFGSYIKDTSGLAAKPPLRFPPQRKWGVWQ